MYHLVCLDTPTLKDNRLLPIIMTALLPSLQHLQSRRLVTQSKLPSANFSASVPQVPLVLHLPDQQNFPMRKHVRSILPRLFPYSLVATGQQSALLSSLIYPASDYDTWEHQENAKEMHMKLHEWIVEIWPLIDNGSATNIYLRLSLRHPVMIHSSYYCQWWRARFYSKFW